MKHQNDPRTLEIYRTIMTWLMNQGPNPNKLEIPVLDNDVFLANIDVCIDKELPVKTRTLVFHRVTHLVTLMPGAQYQHTHAGPPITIWYDPNWQSYFLLDELLQDKFLQEE